MSVGMTLLWPYWDLVRIQCVASASTDALATHWTRRNPY